jgi:hypothetical protein
MHRLRTTRDDENRLMSENREVGVHKGGTGQLRNQYPKEKAQHNIMMLTIIQQVRFTRNDLTPYALELV